MNSRGEWVALVKIMNACKARTGSSSELALCFQTEYIEDNSSITYPDYLLGRLQKCEKSHNLLNLQDLRGYDGSLACFLK